MTVASGWLDPEPPHAEHSETACRNELPRPRESDHGRRWQCGVCGRVYRAHQSEQRSDGPYWTGPIPDSLR